MLVNAAGRSGVTKRLPACACADNARELCLNQLETHGRNEWWFWAAPGSLGVELVRQLRQRGYDVTGWDKGEVDITNAALTERSLAELDPELVINSAAYNQVDVAEREPLAAFQVNALAVRSLALACRQVDARLVQFSTDYVFDGRAGPAIHRRRPAASHRAPTRSRNSPASFTPRPTWRTP